MAIFLHKNMISDDKLNKLIEKYASLQKEAQEANKDAAMAQYFDMLDSQLKASMGLKDALINVTKYINGISEHSLTNDKEQSIVNYTAVKEELQKAIAYHRTSQANASQAVVTLDHMITYLKMNK